MTPAQAGALQDLWPQSGFDYEPRVADLDALFGRRAPRVLEIGFGNGDALLALAAREPDTDFIGIEVHRPGVGSLLRRAAAVPLTNLRVSTHDAVEVLRDQVPPASLAATFGQPRGKLIRAGAFPTTSRPLLRRQRGG